jgi:ADP-ribose pyrophosphatase YjhB (NUDIX family)
MYSLPTAFSVPSMLLFAFLDASDDLDAIAERGLRAASGQRVRLRPSLSGGLSEDQEGADAPVLVVDGSHLPSPPRRASSREVLVSHVPPPAIQNLSPYRPPVQIVAGGGYVARPLPVSGAPADVALLLIFRKGVWDLPKGKQDPGESVEACALREVREEVGINRLSLQHPLGTTQHGYVEDEAYAVKTTWWYLMQTPERQFTPETREGIRRVAWARWGVARAHIGYRTLAAHMDRVAPTVRDVLAGSDAASSASHGRPAPTP